VPKQKTRKQQKVIEKEQKNLCLFYYEVLSVIKYIQYFWGIGGCQT